MNTEFASFSWAACDVERGTGDIGDWRIALRLEDASAPAPGVRGFAFPWSNPGWPSTDPGPGPGLVGNVWLIAKIGGRWNAATFDWLRHPEQGEKDESCESARDDQIRAGAWLSWVPRAGEVVGLMVSGPARTGVRTVRERSAIAWTRIGTRGILGHEGAAPQPQPGPKPDPKPDPVPVPVCNCDGPAILAAIERVSVALVALNARVEQQTGVLAEWMVDLAGQVRATSDQCEALLMTAHEFQQRTEKIVTELSLPIQAEGRLLGQRVTFSGTVGKR